MTTHTSWSDHFLNARATSESLRCLKEELTDFTLSPVDRPTPHTYNAVGGQKKACAGSNVDAERGFSVLRKVHTDQRASLSQSTIITLMSIKMNNSDCCIDTELSDDLLTKCKNATTLTLAKSK